MSDRLLASAHQILETPPAPSLREILAAYRQKGDGDRDMLLAMLSAKTAEDQRLSNIAALHRTMLEVYQHSPPPLPLPMPMPQHHHQSSYRSSEREPPRKRTRISQDEQFPPSPYSASDRSESAECSPRSRSSMTIGSLLSRDHNSDLPPQD